MSRQTALDRFGTLTASALRALVAWNLRRVRVKHGLSQERLAGDHFSMVWEATNLSVAKQKIPKLESRARWQADLGHQQLGFPLGAPSLQGTIGRPAR
jgi:hypothetical protein